MFTILVCDDEKDIVDAIEIYLAQEGYRGSLTLGIMRDTFEPKLPTLYQRFRTAYPHVSLLIRGYSTPACCPRWSGERWTPS